MTTDQASAVVAINTFAKMWNCRRRRSKRQFWIQRGLKERPALKTVRFQFSTSEKFNLHGEVLETEKTCVQSLLPHLSLHTPTLFLN
jgi:hypothetical protein